MSTDCKRCGGCGQIANSDDGEPWTEWEALPPGSDFAVRVGLVKPIPCPDCSSDPESLRYMRPRDGDATPALEAFLAAYADDDNEWWALSSGHHQNLFDAAIERIEQLEHELSKREIAEAGS